MDTQERKQVVVLFSIAFFMWLAGCYFVPFVINAWTYLANLAGEKDVFLATVLLVYFIMVVLFGMAIGLLLNAYVPRIWQWLRGALKKGYK